MAECPLVGGTGARTMAQHSPGHSPVAHYSPGPPRSIKSLGHGRALKPATWVPAADSEITRWMEHWEALVLSMAKKPFKKSLLLAKHWA